MSAVWRWRGNRITWDADGECWRYDDGVPAGRPPLVDRPCTACGQEATPEGYDACVGFVPGATSVCCGHGAPDAALVIAAGRTFRGTNARRFIDAVQTGSLPPADDEQPRRIYEALQRVLEE